MGWLFAVSLGLQEHKREKVMAALPPIALGHLISIGLVVALVASAGIVVPLRVLRVGGAALVIGFGLFRLLRPRLHPRWVSMRVNRGQLVLWSFLMASAHGAGLMLFPLLVAMPICGGFQQVAFASEPGTIVRAGLLVGAIHTMAMLSVMALIAMLVYDRLGLSILRTGWINLDLVWGVALVVAGTIMMYSSLRPRLSARVEKVQSCKLRKTNRTT
jgi:hypothetical protein